MNYFKEAPFLFLHGLSLMRFYPKTGLPRVMHHQIGRSLGLYLENYDPANPQEVADCYFRALDTWQMLVELPEIRYDTRDLHRILRESHANIPESVAIEAADLITTRQASGRVD